MTARRWRAVGTAAVRIVVVLAVLEAALRASSVARSAWREWGRRSVPVEHSAGRVLLVGGCQLLTGWPERLGEALSRRGFAGAEVVNLGRIGPSVRLVQRQLPADMDRYEPDVVVLMFQPDERAEAAGGRWHALADIVLLDRSYAARFARIAANHAAFRLAEAWCLLREVRDGPRSTAFRERLALYHQRPARRELTDRAFRGVLERAPDDPALLRLRAECLDGCGRRAEAAEAFERAGDLYARRLELAPDDAGLLLGAGVCYGRSRRTLPRGVELLLRATSGRARDEAFYREVLSADLLPYAASAVRWKWVRNRPDDLEAHRQLLRSHAAGVRRESAPFADLVPRTEKLLAERPPSARDEHEFRSLLGDYYRSVGRPEDALRSYRAAFRAGPRRPQDAAVVALACRAAGRVREAREWLDLAGASSAAQDGLYGMRYRQTKETVESHGGRLVVLCFPFEDAALLKEVMAPVDDVVFVELGKVLEDSLESQVPADTLEMLVRMHGVWGPSQNEFLAGVVADALLPVLRDAARRRRPSGDGQVRHQGHGVDDEVDRAPLRLAHDLGGLAERAQPRGETLARPAPDLDAFRARHLIAHGLAQAAAVLRGGFHHHEARVGEPPDQLVQLVHADVTALHPEGDLARVVQRHDVRPELLARQGGVLGGELGLGFVVPEQQEGGELQGEVLRGLLPLGHEDELPVLAVEMEVAADLHATTFYHSARPAA
jgi:tetratricopeptide (TPR) repeat protein